MIIRGKQRTLIHGSWDWVMFVLLGKKAEVVLVCSYCIMYFMIRMITARIIVHILIESDIFSSGVPALLYLVAGELNEIIE